MVARLTVERLQLAPTYRSQRLQLALTYRSQRFRVAHSHTLHPRIIFFYVCCDPLALFESNVF